MLLGVLYTYLLQNHTAWSLWRLLGRTVDAYTQSLFNIYDFYFTSAIPDSLPICCLSPAVTEIVQALWATWSGVEMSSLTQDKSWDFMVIPAAPASLTKCCRVLPQPQHEGSHCQPCWAAGERVTHQPHCPHTLLVTNTGKKPVTGKNE